MRLLPGATVRKGESMKHVVTATRLNIRPEPRMAGQPLGLLSEGAEVDVIETVNGWHKVAVGERFDISGVDFTPQIAVARRMPSFAWLSAQWTRPVGQAPVEPAPTPPVPAVLEKRPLLLGMNCLSDIAAAKVAIAAGCRAVTVINQFGATLALRNNGVEVIRRRWLPSKPQLMSGEEMVDTYFEGGFGGGYFAPIFNEGDYLGYGTPEEIAQRAEYDRRIGPVIRARGGVYCAGGFSMGTPDFTSPEICAAMQREYAPGYNRGDYAIGMHLYAKLAYDDRGNLIPISEWFGTSYKFLFTRCGFDPNPALAGIVCDETGEDEGANRGFERHQRTPEQVEAWYRAFVEAVRAPMEVNGKHYPSPLRVATGFKMGHGPEWDGFDQTAYVAGVGRVAALAAAV